MNRQDLKEKLKGIVGIAITPMNENRELDKVGWRKHLNFLVSNGINGDRGVIVTTGSTGECGALNIRERKELLEIAIDEVGNDVPIIAGCNHSDAYQVIDLAQHAEELGAAGVMILPPYYYTPTDEVVLDFYNLVSEHVGLGIMLYNNIEVTHKDVSIEVLTSLAESSNVVGIKECTPNFFKMAQVARRLGDKITVINGHGEFLEPFAALAGTDGFISSIANFAPELTIEMWKARSEGKYGEAVEIRRRFSPYLDLAQRLATIGGEPKVLSLLKRAVDLVGSNGGPGRLPLRELSSEEERQLRQALSDMDL